MITEAVTQCDAPGCLSEIRLKLTGCHDLTCVVDELTCVAVRLGWTRDENARDGVTTNGVESVFAVLKRGLIGTYHHVSPKHLNRYVGEFAFRLNDGDVSRHTMQRLTSLFGAAIGRRLTYKELIA